VVAVVIVAALYVGRELLISVTLALQRRGFARPGYVVHPGVPRTWRLSLEYRYWGSAARGLLAAACGLAASAPPSRAYVVMPPTNGVRS
jgi:hypothetical protein